MPDATPSPSPPRADAPARLDLAAWRRVLARAAATLGRENFTLVAAGCAFYALLALAPSLAALAGLYGLFADPADIRAHLSALQDVAPPAAYGVIEGQASALDRAGGGALGLASLGAVLFAVWSARAGVRAMIAGVSIAYREREGRGFLKDAAVTYLLTLLFIVVAAVTVGVVVILPGVLALLPIGAWTAAAAEWLRWPIALAAVLFGLGALYRWGPNRRPARRDWLTPGAALAVALWLAGSVAFSIYLARFGGYNETYGALGAVVALLMWFWLSALAGLAGAVLNAELELETAADTTVGPDRPMGRRGAHVADRVAETAAARA